MRDRAGIVKKLTQADGLIIGQMIGHGMFDLEREYAHNITKLFTRTGQYPAILGFGFGWGQSEAQQRLAIPYILEWWDAGGLVEAHFAWDNPWTGELWRDMTRTTLTELTENTAAANAFRRTLDVTIGILDDLRLAGVTLLVRFGSEMNYSTTNPDHPNSWWAAQQEYWDHPARIISNYVTWYNYTARRLIEYGRLDNLIFVYAPTFENDRWVPCAAFYPGPEFVDVAGMNTYSNTYVLGEAPAHATLPGHPFALTECGSLTYQGDVWSNLLVLNAGLDAGAKYALWWASWEAKDNSIVDNQHAEALMNDSRSITRDRLYKPAYQVREARRLGEAVYLDVNFGDGARNSFTMHLPPDAPLRTAQRAIHRYARRKQGYRDTHDPRLYALSEPGLPTTITDTRLPTLRGYC